MLKLNKSHALMIVGALIFGVVFFSVIGIGYQLNRPLNLPEAGLELNIVPGDSFNKIAAGLEKKQIIKYPKRILKLYAKLTGAARHVHAGEYRLPKGLTSVQLIAMLRSGQVVQHSITFIEGWTIEDVVKKLQQHPKVSVRLLNIDMQDLLHAIGRPGHHPEGLFFPDTYHFTAYTTDKEILQRAYDTMRDKLMTLWQQRVPESQNLSPYQTLVLASIVEKETALKEEMPQVSGVYLRRLQKGMPLQADPTVIYGMGDKFNGRLMTDDLKFESPYNTYIKRGLPPTPIALPSLASIRSIIHPKSTGDLYFVADGNGGHVFSATYEEHLKAVDKLNALRKKNREREENESDG